MPEYIFASFNSLLKSEAVKHMYWLSYDSWVQTYSSSWRKSYQTLLSWFWIIFFKTNLTQKFFNFWVMLYHASVRVMLPCNPCRVKLTQSDQKITPEATLYIEGPCHKWVFFMLFYLDDLGITFSSLLHAQAPSFMWRSFPRFVHLVLRESSSSDLIKLYPLFPILFTLCREK